MTTPCSCSPGACHGGHTIDFGMPVATTDPGTTLLDSTKAWMLARDWSEISEGPAGWMWQHATGRKVGVPRNIGDDRDLWDGLIYRLAQTHALSEADIEREIRSTTPPTEGHRSPQTTTDPLCPVCECGVVDDLVHIEHVHLGEVAAHNECLPIDTMLDAILSARKAAADAQALAADLGQRCDELTAKRNPDDDVLVEGTWFHPDDLPKILGNHMRSVDEEQRRTKDAAIALDDARARVTALKAAVAARDEQLEAAQREPIGYAVVTTYLGGRWVQTAPVVSLDAAEARARVYVEQEARVVELREVADRD